jgi:hypothetical protein
MEFTYGDCHGKNTTVLSKVHSFGFVNALSSFDFG